MDSDIAQSFKDLMHTIIILYDSNDVAIFATCSWLIWYARNNLRYEGTYSNEIFIAM